MFLADLWRAPLATPDQSRINALTLIGRVVLVAALLPNGAFKLQMFEAIAAAMGGAPLPGPMIFEQTLLVTFPAPWLFLAASVLLDLVGALMIIVGFKARAVGLVLAVYAVAAIVIFHGAVRGMHDVITVLRNLSLAGGCMLVAAAGPGWWSIDGLRARKRVR
jgi:putative oxidoreductase